MVVENRVLDNEDSATITERHHLFWIYPEKFEETLDSATWLETTAVLRELGWKVSLVGVGDEPEKIIRGVPVMNIQKPDVYLIGQVIFHWNIGKWLWRNWDNIDIVLFHQMSAFWILLIRIIGSFRSSRPQFVMDTRTLPMAREDKRSIKDRLRDLYGDIVNKMVKYWADGQLAITTHMANATNITATKLWGVWPSGVKKEIFSIDGDKRNWELVSDEIQLVYVGSLAYERNLMALCHAIKRARESNMMFRLHLVGSGTEQEELKQFAETTDGYIQVDDPIPHSEIPNILVQAHLGVLVFPDELKFRVSSPIKLFEYMASGLPIFASHIPCHTDIVQNKDFAVWVHETDIDGLLAGLQDAWEKRNHLPQMGKIAQENVGDWTWRASAKKLDAALSKGILEKH